MDGWPFTPLSIVWRRLSFPFLRLPPSDQQAVWVDLLGAGESCLICLWFVCLQCKHLTYIDFAHDSPISTTTGRSPFECTFQYQPPLCPSQEHDLGVASVQNPLNCCYRVLGETAVVVTIHWKIILQKSFTNWTGMWDKVIQSEEGRNQTVPAWFSHAELLKPIKGFTYRIISI